MLIEMLLTGIAVASLCSLAAADPIDIGSRLELMVDDYLIESVAAIENLEALAGVDGVDGVFLGPHDITCSMEIPEEYENPEFIDTVVDVIKRCRELGKGVGIHMDATLPLYERYLDAGLNFVLNAADVTKMADKLGEDFENLRE